MYRKKYIKIACVVLCLLAIVACVRSDENSPIVIEEEYVNTQLLLRAPLYSNTFKIGDPLNLELKYNTTNEIVLPYNYNLRIFENTSTGWVEIAEEPTDRFPIDDIILSPTLELPAVHVVVLFPKLRNPFIKTSLRIYVIGDMKLDDQIVKVTAFTDVTLSP